MATKVTNAAGATVVQSTPGAMEFEHPELRMSGNDGSWVDVNSWLELMFTVPDALGTLRLTYTSVSGTRHLEVAMSAVPIHVEPFPRVNGERVLRVAGEPVVSVNWT